MEEPTAGIWDYVQNPWQMDDLGLVVLNSKVPTLNHWVCTCFTIAHRLIVNNKLKLMQAYEAVELQVSIVYCVHFLLQDRPRQLRPAEDAACISYDLQPVLWGAFAAVFKEHGKPAVFAGVSVDLQAVAATCW